MSGTRRWSGKLVQSEARKAENPELVASWQDYNQMLCSDWLMKSC